jgi:hypothetical protein
MIGVAYCGKCHSDEVGSTRPDESGKVRFYCLGCGHDTEVDGFLLGWYFGEHESKVVNKSRPAGAHWYLTEEREDLHEERLPDEAPRPPIKFQPAREITEDELLANDAQREFFVWHHKVSKADVDALEAVLNQPDVREEDVQQALTQRRALLVQHLGGGHGRYVIPKPQFGGKYEPDFLIGERASYGLEWTLVELEAPGRSMFTKKGEVSQWLNHAIRQVNDWRSWLAYHKADAEREVARGGLGLGEIDVRTQGLIIMGRRTQLDPLTNERRRELQRAHNMQIRTYDWLLEVCRGRLWMW